MNSKVGVAGSQILLDVILRNPDGELIDDQNYALNTTLPKVEIIDPDGTVIYDSKINGENNPPNMVVTRESIGKYKAVYLIPSETEITTEDSQRIFTARWSITFADITSSVEQEFDVSKTFSSTFSNVDSRKGFMFGNPDLTSNYYYQNFGIPVTPDEIRYGLFFGNEMVAQNGDWFTSSMIQWYIDNAIELLEKDLMIKIIPKQYRHRPFPLINENDEYNVRTDFNNNENFEWEDGYDYRTQEARGFIYLELRKKPIYKLQKAHFINPVDGSTIINMTTWAKVNHKSGSIDFYPNTFKMMTGNFTFFPFGAKVSLEYFPDSIAIDYIAGYERADKIDKDLRQCIFNLAAWNLLNDIGDGKSAALANSSVSLAGVSESFGTTQSATSALYGARLESIQKWLKTFYERNRSTYTGFVFTSL